ncbi:MAG: hypothetical protein PHU23_02645 [Dehalococcoidales bacterium]|nr:hypothetical protein [Dehalococcoidales bacterium]
MDMALFIMNKDSWNKLPSDLQEVLIEAGQWQDEEIMTDDEKQIQIGVDAAKAANHSFTNLTEDDLKVWRDAASVAHEQYITEFEAKGLPSRAVYDRMMELIQQNK